MRSPPHSSDFSLVAHGRARTSTHRLFCRARLQITPRPPESAPAPTRVAATCGRRPHAAVPRAADPRTGRAPPAARPAPRPARRPSRRLALLPALRVPRVPFGPACYLSSYLLPTRAPATGPQISDSDIE
ncbi:hypothetical protein EVAR_60129_1 [Eumeta japonica]|uniref:Uncharacterized protein n=1 Tax=Eumeta variegata TaxID=151549 RepID=A0A4C2A6J4_EUMVA|nr:hypothetical protein EVAR_60129_1 [Eumeta japonica]